MRLYSLYRWMGVSYREAGLSVQAQRDKLIELAKEWANTEMLSTYQAAEKAFRDYVEHMHDEVKE